MEPSIAGGVKQVLHSYRTGHLELADVPMPAVEPGGLLVRTSVSLLSAGTEKSVLELGKKSLLAKAQDRPDLVQKVVDKVQRDGVVAAARTAWARLDEPMPLGYSCAGTVLRVGAGVRGFRPGDRVACAGAKVANHAEVNAVPIRLCAPVPDEVPDEEAAFVTVGAIALQGVRTAAPALGESVAVIGLGLIGQLAVQILRAAGCKVLGIDVDSRKLDLALAGGARRAVLRGGDVEAAARALSDGRGVDSVIICASSESNDPIELAGTLARDRARIVVVGAVPMDVPRHPFYEKELTVLLSRAYGPGRYDPSYEEQGHDYPAGYVRWTEERNFGAFLDLCADRRVDVRPLVTHRFEIDRAEDAYALLSGERREPYLGILLTYPDRPVAATVPLAAMPAAVRPARGEVRIGFAGAGAFASAVLVPAFARAKGARLSTIVSARGITAAGVGRRFGFAEASTDYEALLKDPAIDAVVVATRHHLHAEQAARALEAGKHVFVEKPLALDAAGLARLRGAAAASGRILQAGFNRRFAPLARKLAAHFADRAGPLSMVYRVNAGPLPRESWILDRAIGGGRIVGEICHFVDLLSFVCGAPPIRAQAEGSGEPPDQVTATLAFADGSVGTIVYATDGDPGYPKERIEVFGAGRAAALDDFRSLDLSRGRRSHHGSLAQDKGHRAEAQAFVAAVAAGGPPPIPLESLVRTTEATFAIETALRSGVAQPIGG